LDRGIREFHTRSKASLNKITGEDAFMLYTSFGFPLDLTQLMAEEQKKEVDTDRFSYLMEEFKQKSRERGNFSNLKELVLQADQTHQLQNKLKIPTTRDAPKYNWVTSGSGDDCQATLKAIWNGKSFVDSVSNSDGAVGIIVDETPFYAEQGGQIFDSGEISGNGFEFAVSDCQKYAGYVMHIGSASFGTLKVGQEVTVKVDYSRRALVAKNHTATHILNFALREVLGDKVDQKGSLVAPDKLRFDFSYNKAIDLDELKRIEEICNSHIQQKFRVYDKDVSLRDGKNIFGLRAVFGETYPDPVRVVGVGVDIDTLISNKGKTGSDISVEFCGGTHVHNAEEIYKLCIVGEESVAKGIRRIVAVTGPQAAVEATLRTQTFSIELNDIKLLKGQELLSQVTDLQTRIGQDKEAALVPKKILNGDLEALGKKALDQGKADTKAKMKEAAEKGEALAKQIGDSKAVAAVIPGLDGDAKLLTEAMNVITKQCPETAILIVCAGASKAVVLAVVPKSMKDKISAKEWAELTLAEMNGKGGGGPTRAQGQSSEPQKSAEALKAAENFLKSKGL